MGESFTGGQIRKPGQHMSDLTARHEKESPWTALFFSQAFPRELSQGCASPMKRHSLPKAEAEAY